MASVARTCWLRPLRSLTARQLFPHSPLPPPPPQPSITQFAPSRVNHAIAPRHTCSFFSTTPKPKTPRQSESPISSTPSSSSASSFSSTTLFSWTSASGNNNGNTNRLLFQFGCGAIALTVSSYLFINQQTLRADAHFQEPQHSSIRFNSHHDHEHKQEPKERLIRLAELRKHGKDAERVWVHRGTAVYDITEWIPAHPGGNVILTAAGGSIDPFWKIFTIHLKQDVLDILEEYRIGTIAPEDLINGEVPTAEIEDPFAADPIRDERLLTHTAKPCNAETPGEILSEFITPNELFYVRNHFWVPHDDESKHAILIELPDGTEKKYTLTELKSKFKEHSIKATLQCSGNRRSHMSKATKTTSGLPWNVGAIGNAEWSGVRLRDVLEDAGLTVNDLPSDARHAHFVGSEAYGASIPIGKAVDPMGDVLLAFKMNGVTLPPDHGYPVRVLVPGHVAARSVKWLEKVVISDEESFSQWQRRDYKCFNPNEGPKPDWDKARSIQETPVQSAICSVTESKQGEKENSVKVFGYAMSGGGREIVRVDISYDGGKTWKVATLEDDEQDKEIQNGTSKRWSWKRWTHEVSKDNVGDEICVKAVDEAYNTQPDTHAPIFNQRGNLATAWHRVPFTKKDS